MGDEKKKVPVQKIMSEEEHEEKAKETLAKREAYRLEQEKLLRENIEKAKALFGEADKDLKKATGKAEVVSSGWFSSFFSKIFDYFFGDTKKKDVINTKDANEFNKRLKETKKNIDEELEELKNQPETEDSKKAVESLSKLQKEFSNNGCIGEIQSAYDKALNIENPGALSGDELKEEFQIIFDALNGYVKQYQGVTQSGYLQGIVFRLQTAIGKLDSPYSISRNKFDFNSKEDVKTLLEDVLDSFRSYKQHRDSSGSYLQMKFREELINTFATQFKNKLAAINKNEELVRAGKPEIQYEPKKNFMTDELADAWTDFIEERELKNAEFEYAKQPSYDAINAKRAAVANEFAAEFELALSNEQELNKDALMEKVQALMAISDIHKSVKESKTNQFDAAVLDQINSKTTEQFKGDAEIFLSDKNIETLIEVYKNGKLKDAAETDPAKKNDGKKMFEGLLHATINDYSERNGLKKDFIEKRTFILRTISTDVGYLLRGSLNKEDSYKKLKLDFEALMQTNDVLKNFNSIGTEKLYELKTYEGLEAGMKKYQDKLNDAFLDNVIKDFKEALDGKTVIPISKEESMTQDIAEKNFDKLEKAKPQKANGGLNM